MGRHKQDAGTTRELIRTATADLNILQYFSARRFFVDLYTVVKQKADSYSYRSFAQDLGYGQTNFMHLVCTGKRHISAQTARAVADQLGLTGERRRYFLTLTKFESARTPSDRSALLDDLSSIIESTLPTKLSQDQFAYFSNWPCVVIREMATRPDFRAEAHWIARQITPHLSTDRVQEALDLLVRIGYLAPSQDHGGALRPTEIHVRTPAEARGAALFKFHHQMIEQGRTSMSRIEGWRRDISGVTVRVDNDTMQRIKTEIQEFRARILKLSEEASAEGKQIYQMNIQFFPFTEVDES
jgi:uncharacterized protein (TIGR02147 family)